MTDAIFVLDEQEEKSLIDFEQAQREQHQPQTETVTVPGYDFLRRCHLPPYFRARIREMRVGDTFFMGSIRHDHELEHGGYEGVAEVYVRKERGRYQLYATWTLLTKPTRAHCFVNVAFKLKKGGDFIFEAVNAEQQLRQICLVSRYIQRLVNNVISEEEKAWFHRRNVQPFFVGVNIDKERTLTRPNLIHDEKGNLKRVFYVLPESMMPKPMMECIVDVGIALGHINFD